MTRNEMHRAEQQKIDRMMRELQRHLSDLVQSGDITPQEANEWANMKAAQWAKGLS